MQKSEITVNEFIDSCKLLLRDGVMEYNVIGGHMAKCTNYSNDKIEVIKSMDDYSLLIKKKNVIEPIIYLDEDGIVSVINVGWKEFAKELQMM